MESETEALVADPAWTVSGGIQLPEAPGMLLEVHLKQVIHRLVSWVHRVGAMAHFWSGLKEACQCARRPRASHAASPPP